MHLGGVRLHVFVRACRLTHGCVLACVRARMRVCVHAWIHACMRTRVRAWAFGRLNNRFGGRACVCVYRSLPDG
jgi:hypothetical protein